mmetsp:Transcript_115721/g.247352  ORF Transcript_115721/g.247352 Transcript_115721/m.247352 type:complete len:153 (+) Transcript_115721:70-528(+)
MSPSIPKVAMPPEKWTKAVYSTPDGSMAKSEVGKLTAMQFDPEYWSKAYVQCVGRGLSHKECVASIPDDTRITALGPLALGQDLTGALNIACETGDPAKCADEFQALKKVAGYEEPVVKGKVEQFKDVSSKLGWKMLGFPAVFYAMKFIKIK